MSNTYDFKKIEKKWQDFWEESGVFNAENNSLKPKFYGLIEFPYPSGQGLHVGHPRSYTAIDIIARKRRLQGYNVLFPIGWDAFGLPTENFAIKHKIHPKVVTEQNIARFKQQLKSLGFSFDWSREINTIDPQYYKWTQWIFLQLFKHGLAYKKESAVNWCTSCKCVLANEEVVCGKCERCDSSVVHKNKSQWILKITKYAKRLIDDLKLVDYPEKVKNQQINWIGESKGAEIFFKTDAGESIKVFTTRPETIFGATYIVISPEHEFLNKTVSKIKNVNEIVEYQALASKKSDIERGDLNKEKSGVKIDGICAIHPINGKKLPIFVADYVLVSYGTGSIMAVPAHDERDKEFAQKFGLQTLEVLHENKLINSDFLNDLTTEEAKEAIINWLEHNKLGNKKVNYKLRDWVFSRQRYWGEPIPMVFCADCGYVPLSENDLPLKLPDIEFYETTDDGESPLSTIDDWVNTNCPKCGKNAKRETDTMPQWAGSSWYFLRYMDAHNEKILASRENIAYWSPVDWYNGGMEHTTLHLLYSRFWHKFLFDIGVVPTPEPYKKRTSHGMILGENNEKMSKSKGNVVNPDEIIDEFGADTLRLYEMFIGDFEKEAPWSSINIKGCKRFLERFWKLRTIVDISENYYNLENDFHKTVKKVTNDIENMKFNTAIAAMMELINKIFDLGKITKNELKIFSILLNPFAPHITEEIFEVCNLDDKPLCSQVWPSFDEAKCVDQKVTIAIQVNGKLRATMIFDKTIGENQIVDGAQQNEVVQKFLIGKTILKKIYVKEKIVNFVVK